RAIVQGHCVGDHGFRVQAALNLRMVSQMIKEYVDELAVQKSSILSFDKFTLTQIFKGLFTKVSFDVVNPSPLSVLVLKLRDDECDTCACSKFRLGTFEYSFQWERNDSEVHEKMVCLIRNYLSKGARCASMDGNDF
ncbi:hypothetical protein PMAYCL1PPCAC_21705, partial [Pristionchus mayeri]